MKKHHYSILFTIIGLLNLSQGCSIDGVSWFVPETRVILDTFRGIVFSSSTQNIQGINVVRQGEGLNGGHYITVSLDQSTLIIETNTAFESYENIEKETTITYTITLQCSDSSTRNFVLILNITDTNNNDPVFLPTNNYEFTIFPPVPPGFVVTTCLNDILVRDIDLTTYRIDFEVEGSNLFEISFDPSSEVAKEFKATLKTTDLIRSLAEPIKLTVTATDVDRTEDPPRTATATVVITADSQFQFPDEPIFSQPFYLANYKSDNDVILQDRIFLSQGYDNLVEFSFEGDHSEYFGIIINENDISFNIKDPIPADLYDERQIYLIVTATREHTSNASATIIVKLPEDTRLEFENAIYEGTITDNILELADLKLTQGYEGYNITVEIESDYAFSANVESNVIKISMDSLATDVIQNNNFINLQITASNNRTTAVAVVILEIIKDDYITPVFENNFYSGSYSTELGLKLEQIILIQGFDKTVNITLEGDHINYFKINQDGPRITLTSSTIPTDIFNERNIMISVLASKPRTVGAHAAVNIDLPSEPPEIDNVSFDQNLYKGKLHNGVLSHDKITLSGFSETNIQITGEHKALFRSELTNGVVKVEATETEFPRNLTYIALELQAASASAVLLIDVSFSDPSENDDVSFDQVLYNGKLLDGVLTHDKITVSGFNGPNILITGEHNSLFKSELTNGVVTVEATGAEFPRDLTYILLELQAASANAVLLIRFKDPSENDDVSFDQILYNGKLLDGVLTHDKITVSGFKGPNILITGEHNSLFKSELTNGVVKVEASGAEFPRDLTYILLELQAASANAVLFIDVSFSDNPQLPTVTFKSQSYYLWADVEQTGVVGAVEATADNGEAIIYSLSGHIQNQININSNGEILLTSVFDKGVYTFNAVATSVQSQVQATAPVLLRVDALPECSNEAGLSPLIILERLEEEPHRNLVVVNQTEHKGCRYTLSNVFPKDQSWLYVDNDGLHTKAIDREDRSIAFMTLSQIQVELTLDCDSDEVPAFAKRSLSTEDKSDLYSYDDGPNKWVLTDSILFNARRSFVNLIVTDINDNSPIFLGKGNEPIYVGYPVSELEGTVSPRALAELKATDADIGENAAIIYWSQEENLAVSPSTGLVHVRNNAELENNSRLTIYAIDQNGKGRNGTIDIVVKLLDKNQIIVLTVRDAFLEDEVDVVNDLSVAVGYEIKVLRAVVIPNNIEELSRRKRDVASSSQASLQLYAYGLLESEPVDINQLTRDINNINIATVNIAGIVSLEDHLAGLEIGPTPGRDTGLLAATIVLAVLLLIAIVAIAVRFFLKWKTSKNYKQFSNRSSSTSQLSTPNLPKIEVVPKLRPDIDEIKRTERRLQEMLETPIEKPPVRQAEDVVKPPLETPNDTLVNISSPDAQLPIVIQSIDKLKDKTDDSDDNDEFGEVRKPRKSVVTFNENVEKIIHIEDVPDDNSSENSLKIYKL